MSGRSPLLPCPRSIPRQVAIEEYHIPRCVLERAIADGTVKANRVGRTQFLSTVDIVALNESLHQEKPTS